MNIALFVSVLDQPGGAEIGTMRLAEGLAQRGHTVTLLTTQSFSRWWVNRQIIDYANHVRIIRLPVWQRNRRIFARMLAAQALWAFPLLLRETQIVHLRGLLPETLTLARIARRLGMKTLCVPMASGAYGDIVTFPPHVSHNANAFHWISALTEPLRAEVVAWGFPAERTGVIPNGVDTDLFTPPDQPRPNRHVVFVGQFRPEKRVDLLLRAWQRVHTACPEARLTLVGGGGYLLEYERLAAQLGLSPTFIPNTEIAGVISHLQASSIFVLPGISEGMSNALLEAMAVGLAAVVSDTPANRAVITSEIDGLTYPADSPDALAAQITRLLDDETLRQRIGLAARNTVVQRFTLDKVTDQYLALYAYLLGETG